MSPGRRPGAQRHGAAVAAPVHAPGRFAAGSTVAEPAHARGAGRAATVDADAFRTVWRLIGHDGRPVTALAMTYWISAVRPHRVRRHGETYACRLLETLDWPTAAPSPAAPAPPLA